MKTGYPKWSALVSVVLIGFTLGCNVISSSAKRSNTAREYIYHLNKGEFEAAAKLLSARWSRPKEFSYLKTAFELRGGVKTIETKEEVIAGKALLVGMIATFNNGEVDEVYFDFVKENGEWKISDYAFGKPYEGSGKPPPNFQPLK